MKRIGVISDTHGLLRPEVTAAFDGVELILHAGDIGEAEVIRQLKSIAPVVAVRGNNDTGSWARAIPETKITRIGRVSIYMLHNLKEIDLDPSAKGFQVVISGHSHRASIETRGGVLFLPLALSALSLVSGAVADSRGPLPHDGAVDRGCELARHVRFYRGRHR